MRFANPERNRKTLFFLSSFARAASAQGAPNRSAYLGMAARVDFFSSTCADTESYDLSSVWLKQKFLRDTTQEGGMLYKLVTPPADADAGIYAYKSSRMLMTTTLGLVSLHF